MATAKSRPAGVFCRLQLCSQQLCSQHGNGADWIKFLCTVRPRPYFATRVLPPSSGMIGMDTSRYLGTASSGTMKCWQLTTGRLSR
ncbi:unnamed protein product [Calypogeia fissa]